VSTLTAWYPVRKRKNLVSSSVPASRPPSDRDPSDWRPLFLPGVAALITGAGSSLIWTFGPLLMTGPGPVAFEQIGWLWIALGLGGLLGIFTGALVASAGLSAGWCTCAGALALASAGLLLSVATAISWMAYASMGLFGAGYMGLSGILILWARHAPWANAGAGTSILFIALATGQALGSVAFGMLQEVLSPAALGALAAGLCATGGLVPVMAKR
jgi:predicted MFS family arabinose efflux permease